jgi:hypothetical protein
MRKRHWLPVASSTIKQNSDMDAFKCELLKFVLFYNLRLGSVLGNVSMKAFVDSRKKVVNMIV